MGSLAGIEKLKRIEHYLFTRYAPNAKEHVEGDFAAIRLCQAVREGIQRYEAFKDTQPHVKRDPNRVTCPGCGAAIRMNKKHHCPKGRR